MQKKRFSRAGAFLAAAGFPLVFWAALAAPQSGESPEMKQMAHTQFVRLPDAPDCNLFAVEHGQPKKGASIMLIKGTAKCAVPWHWHVSSEEIMMFRGTAVTQMQGGKEVSLQSGDYYFVPPHHVMRFACVEACTVFLYSNGPFEIHYVDAAGKEISADQALKSAGKSGRMR